MCVKVGYESKAEAERVMKGVVYRNHLNGNDHRSKGLNVYHCDECDRFHYGHLPSVPLLYHYTTGQFAVQILEAGFLRADPPRFYDHSGRRFTRRVGQGSQLDEPFPLLWFSRDPYWEYSVLKGEYRFLVPCSEPFGGSEKEVVCAQYQYTLYGVAAHDNHRFHGVYRFAVYPSVAPLRWSDYLALNPTPNEMRNGMSMRGEPTNWCATDQRVDLDKVVSVEVFIKGQWRDFYELTDADFDFDAYVASRTDAYSAVYPRYPMLPNDLSWFASIPKEQRSVEYDTLLRDAFARNKETTKRSETRFS